MNKNDRVVDVILRIIVITIAKLLSETQGSERSAPPAPTIKEVTGATAAEFKEEYS